MPADQSQNSALDQAETTKGKQQGVSEATCQSEQAKENPPATDLSLAGPAGLPQVDKLTAMLARSANMTPEEWQKNNPEWPSVPQGCNHAVGLRVLDEVEGRVEASEEDGDDTGHITQRESTESEEKHKGR